MEHKQVVRDRGTSFRRVFSILEAVINANSPLSVSEISRTVGLPVATTHRLCKMLIEEHLLQYEIDGKLVLGGPRLFEFASRVMSASHFDLERRAILEALTEEIGETCNIAIADGARMVYAERVESLWPLRIQFPAGTRVPMHCTASGKLYLSHLDPPRVDNALSSLGLRRHTSRSITSIKKLKTEISRIRKQGYAIDNEEFIDGMVAISVPIYDDHGRFCAGLALHSPKLRMSRKEALDKLPTLKTAADRIMALMKTNAS